MDADTRRGLIFLLTFGLTLIAVGFGSNAMGYKRGIEAAKGAGWVNKWDHKILLGPVDLEKCQLNTSLAIWENMNKIGMYRWAAACEDEVRDQTDG